MADRTWYHVASPGQKTETTISPSHFTLSTPPNTDIWRPSTTEDRFDAPYIYTSLRSGSFKSLAVTVSAAWKTKFDQGGLLIFWPASSGKQNESKWMKTGIEFFEGKPALSVVGCDRFSDWSLCPMPMQGMEHATICAERDGTTLWVFLMFNGEKRALREIKWAWMEGREADAEVWVGVCAAKPTPDEGDEKREKELEVVFRDLKLETN